MYVFEGAYFEDDIKLNDDIVLAQPCFLNVIIMLKI